MSRIETSTHVTQPESPKNLSIRHRMDALISRLFTIVQAMEDNKRARLQSDENEYGKLSNQMSSLHRKIGGFAPISTAAALAIGAAAQWALQGNPTSVEPITSMVSQLGGVYTAHLQANETTLMANQNLLGGQISAERGKTFEDEIRRIISEISQEARRLEADATKG